MVRVCCLSIPSKKKGEDEDAKVKEADSQETVAKDMKLKDATSKEKSRAVQVSKQPAVELIKLPPPAKLPGSNYNIELLLSGNNTTGSIASSHRSYMRSPESDFIPDPTEVEYASDPEDHIEATRRNSTWNRLSRRRSDNSNNRSESPDSDKRVSIVSIQRPSSNPSAKEADGSPPYNQAAYTYSVRQNTIRRIQADLESEHSSRSVTPGSKGFRGLETVVEIASNHQNERQSGPRDGIELEMHPDISAVDIACLPRPPPAAKLSNGGFKVHPTDMTTGDRRRSSCPKPNAATKVTATNLVIRERGSLPHMPPPAPVLSARPSRADQDDESFRTWRLSQYIPRGESQTVLPLPLQPQDIPLPLDDQSTTAIDDKDGSEAQSQCGTFSNSSTVCDAEKLDNKLAAEPIGASQPASTSESAQSQDGSGWETWLLAEKLTSLEDSIAVQDLTGKKKVLAEEPKVEASALQQGSCPKPQDTLPLKDDLEVKTSLVGGTSVPVIEPSYYPSSSVYSSAQNTGNVSPSGFKDSSGDDNRNSIAESLIDLDLANFDLFNNLKEQPSDESYRTALDKNPDSETAVSAAILPSEEGPGTSGFNTGDKNHRKYDILKNVSVTESQRSASLNGPEEGFDGSQADVPNGGNVPTRKSSFLQFLGIRKDSSIKGRRHSYSQSSTDHVRLSPSSVSNQVPKGQGHTKRLLSHSITPSTQQGPSDDAFTAPGLTESATTIWQRAFQVEHDQRQTKSTKSTTEAKKTAGAKYIMGPISVTVTNASHITDGDAAESRHGAVKAPNSMAARNASQSSTSQQSLSGIILPQKLENNEDRTGTASLDDDVMPKDFMAVPGSEIAHGVDFASKTSLPNVVEIKNRSQSMSKKIGNAMKTSLGKMMPSKPGAKSPAQLEYPELEILPTKEGYKDLEALQRSIETLKGSEYAKMATNPALAIADLEDKSASSLRTLPAQLHEAEHARHDSAKGTANSPVRNDVAFQSKDAHGDGTEPPSIRPVTPANMITLPAGDSTTATTELWATPASRLSYTTALDENDAGEFYKALEPCSS
ncbi:hypothetical protein CORC01_02387 [Colletotrichum orchidophilum]|uniref:Uncharacterized protein n=1 Tax=Colletotrichum orchidophilum TaxID=1209926 RepID=A0A1G4BLV7_9PEZI|nr:uncharacterized protein CORC01_02387 [Colletotrichum orchidophilum]OHF02394.1 hypothetical protein CORC01_02387 [Colletotrichum orchidophilum]